MNVKAKRTGRRRGDLPLANGRRMDGAAARLLVLSKKRNAAGISRGNRRNQWGF